jgi:hypothetical protein
MEKNHPHVEIKGSYVPAVFFAALFFWSIYATFVTYQSDWLLSEVMALTGVNALFGGFAMLFLFRAHRPLVVLDADGLHHAAIEPIRWSAVRQAKLIVTKPGLNFLSVPQALLHLTLDNPDALIYRSARPLALLLGLVRLLHGVRFVLTLSRRAPAVLERLIVSCNGQMHDRLKLQAVLSSYENLPTRNHFYVRSSIKVALAIMLALLLCLSLIHPV